MLFITLDKTSICSVLLFLCFVVNSVWAAGLNEEFTWTRIDFAWPSDGKLTPRLAYRGSPYESADEEAFYFRGPTNAENVAIKNHSIINTQQTVNKTKSESVTSRGSIDYRYVNNIPMGANVWGDKLFITIPRRRLGVPSTLNYVPLNSINRHNVPLIPYPNWDINIFSNGSENAQNFVSVYRVAIDSCDRMWFVDTGIIEIVGNPQTIKPHQLIIINLKTGAVTHRFNIPADYLTPRTILSSVTVDVTKDTCDDAFAYFPDLAGFGLTVFSLSEERFWRVNHNYFYVEPLAGDFFIAGHNFQWSDGVFSVELGELKQDGFRDMYFHSMAGTHMYKVSTKIIKNQTLATRSYHGDDFEVVGDRGPQSQTAMADLNKSTGVMFLGLVNQNAVGCWNTNSNLNTISIVQKDDERMIYPSDVKVYGDKVYILTNTMPEFLYGRLDYDRVNFRVWSNDIHIAITGTRCQRR
ncbi:L-dopachrome tautomerase yellow-f2-like [Sitophilus oryzae]|uniref:L-dopachrome tautomerase yellow-f2-like n=1 Tax=Sitophilus oryzae TaxID=7048 RepID=A0A6J2YJ75_SITOR|nr:L-dopachrome tautomerase yellow-f2-like [Sitophilus oryzae]